MLVFRHPRTGQLWPPANPGQRALLIRHGWTPGEIKPVSVIEYLNGMYPSFEARPEDLAACRVCLWTWTKDDVYIAARTHVRMTRHSVDLIVDGFHREPLTRWNTPRPGEAA